MSGRQKRKTPAVRGKELCDQWYASTTERDPHGNRDFLQALVNFRINQGKKASWNSLGCGNRSQDITDAIAHHGISTKSAQKLPKSLALALA
jgi:hypothetical protein